MYIISQDLIMIKLEDLREVFQSLLSVYSRGSSALLGEKYL